MSPQVSGQTIELIPCTECGSTPLIALPWPDACLKSFSCSSARLCRLHASCERSIALEVLLVVNENEG